MYCRIPDLRMILDATYAVFKSKRTFKFNHNNFKIPYRCPECNRLLSKQHARRHYKRGFCTEIKKLKRQGYLAAGKRKDYRFSIPIKTLLGITSPYGRYIKYIVNNLMTNIVTLHPNQPELYKLEDGQGRGISRLIHKSGKRKCPLITCNIEIKGTFYRKK